MRDEVYHKLARVLDTLPSGFPPTEDGLEIKLLKKIFRPDEARIFCDLRLVFETTQQIAKRTGRPLQGLDKLLTTMWKRGQIFGVNFLGVKLFRMVPWSFGIYQFQAPHMDRELAVMCEKYMNTYRRHFFQSKPQAMQVLPTISESESDTSYYEHLSYIIENGESFFLNECVCRKQRRFLDEGCDKPLEVCIGVIPVTGLLDGPWAGRAISKEQTYEVLQKCEKAGLVHMTWNMQDGRMFICNCCGCCCGALRTINELDIPPNRVVNSFNYAQINPNACNSCGICSNERCPVNAIEETNGIYRVIKEKCIGCGLCISSCPSEAIRLIVSFR
jgi:NAD-dependent dihydropyrimidine dehydrogenase PreA subunit